MGDLLQKIEELPCIDDLIAEEYYASIDEMKDYVDESMNAKENIDELIGYNSQNMMFNYHENQGLLMSNVLSFNEMRLLIDVFPRVFSTYISKGFSRNYFYNLHSCWIEAAEKHMGGEYRRPVIEIYRWLKEYHDDFMDRADEYDIPPLYMEGEKKEEGESLFDEFLDALLLKESRACRAILEDSISSREDFIYIARNVIKPALYTVGYMWEKGNISVAEEHRATSIVSRILSTYYMKFLPPGRSRGSAVISAVANEQHEMGARMVADFLEFDGWSVSFLGAGTPLEDLISHLENEKPFLLGLSVSLPQNLISLKKTVSAVRGREELEDINIMAGGKALNDLPYLQNKIDADAFARNGEEALEISRGWWH